jgi:hypothetical protein
MLEFDAGVIGRKLPVGFGVMGIAVSLPCGNVVDDSWRASSFSKAGSPYVVNVAR